LNKNIRRRLQTEDAMEALSAGMFTTNQKNIIYKERKETTQQKSRVMVSTLKEAKKRYFECVNTMK